mmetsp:Transcript_11401/g.39789  ORF Transcript_11401/g.39789 Transcript_11401/m.39789 type:complete len:248 (-) Transcript_11401:170-913(-)
MQAALGFAAVAGGVTALVRWRRRCFERDSFIDIDPSLGPNDDAKLAPFLPTSQAGIDKALEVLGVGPGDTLLDLGCGDGRVIVTAAERYGITCVGVEYDPRFARRAAQRVAAHALRSRVTVLHADALTFDIDKYSVIFIFLTPSGIDKIGDRLVEAYHKGVRIAAYMFRLFNLPVAAHEQVRGKCPVYMYDKSKPSYVLPPPISTADKSQRLVAKARRAAMARMVAKMRAAKAKADASKEGGKRGGR